MPTEEQKIEELNDIKNKFNERLDFSKKVKGELFKLYRQKLEEEKIKKIKLSISDNL